MPARVITDAVGTGGSVAVLAGKFSETLEAWTGIVLSIILICYWGYRLTTDVIDRRKARINERDEPEL